MSSLSAFLQLPIRTKRQANLDIMVMLALEAIARWDARNDKK